MARGQSEDLALPSDIVAEVQKAFGATAEAALGQLVGFLPAVLQWTPSTGEATRILRCVVALAEGDIQRLSDFLKAAAGDYRDVIFWAEYTNLDAPHPRRIRDFSRPFPQDGSRLPIEVKPDFKRKR